MLNLNLIQNTVVPKFGNLWEGEVCLQLASLGCCVAYLMCIFGCLGFAMTLTMFVLYEGHYTNRYNPYRFVHEYRYKLGKVRSHLFPPEFLVIFSTAFRSMGSHHIHTNIPFSDCISSTSCSCCITPEMVTEIYAKMLEHFQHDMTKP
jgi:hypothetical protein